MKYRKGYILIESVITLSVIMILASIIYSIVHLSINIKLNIEDKIELQQQAMEITNYIDELIGNSKGIIGITSKEEINNFLSVTSIKCKYKDSSNKLQDKEIKFIPSSNKLFIKDGAYIGMNSSIVARSSEGVVIGENAVVGACSLVNKSVADNSVVVGVPAREISKIR